MARTSTVRAWCLRQSCVRRCSGSSLVSVDDAAARKVAGVTDVVKLPEAKPPYLFKPLGGVAVIGTSTWATMQGRKALAPNWSASPNASFDSAAFRTSLMDVVKTPGRVVREQGNVDATIGSGTVHEATYYTPMLAHAPMEPPMAVAEVQGGKAEVWTCTQNPQAVQDAVAEALGITPADVTCHVTLLGGGFGRKSKPDYAAEAALLARQVGKPVKVVWTREDDLQFDYFHAPSAQYLKAAVGANGLPTAWLQRTAFPPIGSTFDDKEQYGGFQVEHGVHRHPVSDRQSAGGEQPGALERPHRLAPIGGAHPSCVCGAEFHRRTRRTREGRSCRVPPEDDRRSRE